jgi:hypothetical protein
MKPQMALKRPRAGLNGAFGPKLRSIRGGKNFSPPRHQDTKFLWVSCTAAGDAEQNCMRIGFGFSWCLGVLVVFLFLCIRKRMTGLIPIDPEANCAICVICGSNL